MLRGEIEFTDAVGTPKSVGIGTTVSINTSGIITATTFVGGFTGDLTGTAQNATNAVTLADQAASHYLNYNNFLTHQPYQLIIINLQMVLVLLRYKSICPECIKLKFGNNTRCKISIHPHYQQYSGTAIMQNLTGSGTANTLSQLLTGFKYLVILLQQKIQDFITGGNLSTKCKLSGTYR